MLRDKNLIPLSHQHQHALALCVRIDRAGPIAESDLEAWRAEVAQHFRSEIVFHFAAEEKVLFPEARGFPELVPLVEELEVDHAELREHFRRAEERRMSAVELAEFAQRLAAHVRKEERNLFEKLQKLMTPEELTTVGRKLSTALEAVEQACAVPNPVTELRSAR